MRITIKIDSATADEVRKLQQAMHAACGPNEIGGMTPHSIIPGADSHSPTAVFAWAMGPESWSASTPAVPGAYGVEMLRELANRLAGETPPDFDGFTVNEWREIHNTLLGAGMGGYAERIAKGYGW